MVFSSLVFLSIFLPAVLLISLVLPGVRSKNAFLLLASLVFYAYGEPVYVILLLMVSLENYIFAIWIDKSGESGRRILLLFALLLDLGALGVFKYAGFLVDSVNHIFSVQMPVPQIALPVGISFYTFQAISYLIDVYRGTQRPQKNFARLLLYISFFPQLIAGPIVKYHDIAKEIAERKQSAAGMYVGMKRFAAGLGKKVLIANTMAMIADTAFAAPQVQINMLTAWLAAIAYLFQIYFDFSGYSDMAIGLGWMFGFHFQENFRYPYMASSIRDFWRRWHISLSEWFRDYLYIPLGGNRKGRMRTSVNKMIVFLCTGIWHGASVNFIFWGFYHGCFLMLEEYVPVFRRKHRLPGQILMHIYTMLVVLIGFVFFRAETMTQGCFWVGRMFAGVSFSAGSMVLFQSLLTPMNLMIFAVAVLAMFPVKYKLEKIRGYEMITAIGSLCVLALCMLSLSGNTYNPFIYFRF